jgi:hypothetical protein
VKRRGCGIGEHSGTVFCRFLLAQGYAPFLSGIHTENHKQTKYHHQDEKVFHGGRIAQSLVTVLYRGFANTKQL